MRTQAVVSAIAVAMTAGAPLWAGAAESGAQGRVVVLPTQRVGSDVPGPQSPSAARKEAAAAWAENRRACREEVDRSARRDCLQDARADHDRLLEYAAQAARQG